LEEDKTNPYRVGGRLMAKKRNDPDLLNDLHERVARLEADLKWVKKLVEKLDNRTWYILAGIIISVALTIGVNLL